MFKETRWIKAKFKKIRALLGWYNKNRDMSDDDPIITEKENEIHQRIKELKEVIETEYTVSSTRDHSPRFCGSAYVSFETEEMANLVMDNMAVKGFGGTLYSNFGSIPKLLACFAPNQRHQLRPLENSDAFYIEPAEVPAEIIFENLGKGWCEKFTRQSIATIASLTGIGAIFGFLFYMKGREIWLGDSDHGKFYKICGQLFITVLIKVACYLSEEFIDKMVEFERRETITERNIANIWRSCLSVFLNSVVMSVGASLYYQEAEVIRNVYTDNSISDDLFFLLLLGLVDLAIDLLTDIFKTILTRMEAEKDPEIIQIDLNKAYEVIPFNYPRKAERYFSLLFLTFFQMSVFL